MDNDKQKKKTGYQHSTTVYLDRKFNSELVEAIKLRAARKHGVQRRGEGLGKQSKYIRNLIMADLVRAGLFDETGSPVQTKIEEERSWLETELQKPPYSE